MDDLQKLRDDVRARKLAQNARRAKAGKPPMWPDLPTPGEVPKAKRAPAGLPRPESGDWDDSAMSFNEWKLCGYGVKKGEKCSGFDMLGVPQFTALQVRKVNPNWKFFSKK